MLTCTISTYAALFLLYLLLHSQYMITSAKPSSTGGVGSKDVLQKVMDARQLAIKLLSNVTCKSMGCHVFFVNVFFSLFNFFFSLLCVSFCFTHVLQPPHFLFIVNSLYVFFLNFILDGYTSAGFSGRMPMAELADAIVQVILCNFALLFCGV